MKTPVDKDLLRFVGEQIRNARVTAGYSQQEIAEQLSVSTQTMSGLETGKQGIPITVLRNCCKLLHVSSDRLLFGDGIEENDITFFLEQLKNIDSKYLPSLRDVMEHHIKFITDVENAHSIRK